MLPEHPWGSRRDELSVLEEEFDELCHRHDKGEQDDAAWETEEAVLKEQAETEDRSEDELTARVGPTWLEEPEGCGHDHEHEHGHAHKDGPHRPLRDLARLDTERDPVYERALTLAAAVYRWAREAYAKERHPLVYRVAVNACLVPMKVSYAFNELFYDDPFAADVADKELELAGTYLGRSAASLVSLAEEGMLPDGKKPLIAEHGQLGAAIEEARARIKRERGNRSDAV